ncbi:MULTISPECIES: MFS transporter [unclassified Sphingopyxis]|uniref:MFS transporter n=1 Tax=unclassified Sphingopyxis TaxID=2614943 RepID=UPI000730FF44|nr:MULTISPECIES: MFS transporter [unclassified Sphingopyxis]KTE24157.1 MFS transporter [Sphingopyxis sp. H057]KTE50454.1 MFS transporter [Sphingopyxis sp. H073]KTE52543.1 MFS transporter [Sphingopyxis sp. H071]KTE63036.1 MFS transporter [Sphingopyxis sp. H107]KTE64925.1 MFS transporter [Sphingopyxis sp. H100]
MDLTPYRTHRRILTASLVGTAVEFYDFYIYGTAAALVFGPLFFPTESASAQLLYSFMTFGLAFFARPVGAIVFGHYGDRIGRKSTLVASLMLMGGSTLLIAFLPTYAMVGWVAPLLLCLLRFGQGFGLGGEWGGAALLAVENAPPGWRSRFGMFPQLGAPVGFIAANGLFLLLGLGLSDADFANWGWRIPFLFSALLVGLGLWVRLKIGETPAFAEAIERDAPVSVPLGELFRHHLIATLAGTFAVVACFAIFYLATSFALAHGTSKLGYPKEQFLLIQLGAILFMAAGIVFAGYRSDASSAQRVLSLGCGATILIGFLFGPSLASGSWLIIFLGLAAALFVMGLVYGPLGSWLTELFPVHVRYTGASVAFNAGGILGGAMAPIVAQALAEWRGTPVVGLYLALAGLVSWLGLLMVRRPKPA